MARYTARIAATLRTARQEADSSLREVATRAGTSHATLLAYEQGALQFVGDSALSEGVPTAPYC